MDDGRVTASTGPGPHIELLWWSGCPSHPEAKMMLETQMLEVGLDPADLDTMQVVTQDEAERERFIGSPTIRIDGIDIVDPGVDAAPALTCRLYFLQNGRPSALPDPEDLRTAIAHALA